MKACFAPENDSHTAFFEGWTLRSFASVASTNLEARNLPPWHAVRADIQTGGYGRTGRTWVSNAGGLWISAVLPATGSPSKWATLPLAAGWAAVEALSTLGVENLRLRWPNDIMVGRRKLAGLLVERFQPDTAVVGLGLNVVNQPDRIDPSLAGTTVRLSELISGGHSVDDLARLMLRSLRHLHRLLEQNSFADIAAEITERWTAPSQVELSLNRPAGSFRGQFNGIDHEGRLWLMSADGKPRAFAATDVALMREIDP